MIVSVDRHDLEVGRLLKERADLFEIIELVGHNPKGSVWRERPCNRGQEITGNHSPALVSSLRPGIWKKKMKNVHRSGGQ